MQFYRILIFNTLQFCTKPVQFFCLNRITTIEKVPLFHLPEVAGREAFDVGIGGTQVKTKLFDNASSPLLLGFLLNMIRAE